MADARVARRYAQALYDVAARAGAVERVEDDFNGVAGLIESDAKFRDFLFSPKIGRDQRMRIMEVLFAASFSPVSMSALRLLLAKRREDTIVEVRDRFVEIRREQGNVLYASITSATELGESDRKRIVEKLEKSSGKRVEAGFKIDPQLIAGVRVAYGNHVLDGSVRGSLRRLKDQFRYELLKQA